MMIKTSKYFEKGVTLIELLIVIALIGIITVISFSTITSINNKQQLDNATNDLVNILNIAKSRAVSGVRLTNQTNPVLGIVQDPCTTNSLVGYRVDVTIGTTYTLSIICNNDTSPHLVNQGYSIQKYNTSFASNKSVQFDFNGDVENPNSGVMLPNGVVSFTINGQSSQSETIKVDGNGRIIVSSP